MRRWPQLSVYRISVLVGRSRRVPGLIGQRAAAVPQDSHPAMMLSGSSAPRSRFGHLQSFATVRFRAVHRSAAACAQRSRPPHRSGDGLQSEPHAHGGTPGLRPLSPLALLRSWGTGDSSCFASVQQRHQDPQSRRFRPAADCGEPRPVPAVEACHLAGRNWKPLSAFAAPTLHEQSRIG
jgi:hypothetical protein